MMKTVVVGQRFGHVVVLELEGSNRGRMWRCKCDCGSEFSRTTSQLNASACAMQTCSAKCLLAVERRKKQSHERYQRSVTRRFRRMWEETGSLYALNPIEEMAEGLDVTSED